MKHVFFVCALFLFPLLHAGNFEKNYGIGVVHAALDQQVTLSFWENPATDKTPWFEVTFRFDSASPYSVKMISDSPKDSIAEWLQPEYFNTSVEKARIYMNCLEKKEKFCRVIIHTQKKKTAWVSVNEKVQMLSWLGFYQSMASIDLPRDTENKIYEKPDTKSPFKIISGQRGGEDHDNTDINPLQVKGRWMQVQIEDWYSEGGERKVRKVTGWILWRDADKPLIAYNIMGC
ncbi:MAG: hypothetical protein FD123_154 [Bacteroidetes bacterium]|nr:MAG: hypothetical protein FD123_154 [Bacteroidota bacterium]